MKRCGFLVITNVCFDVLTQQFLLHTCIYISCNMYMQMQMRLCNTCNYWYGLSVVLRSQRYTFTERCSEPLIIWCGVAYYVGHVLGMVEDVRVCTHTQVYEDYIPSLHSGSLWRQLHGVECFLSYTCICVCACTCTCMCKCTRHTFYCAIAEEHTNSRNTDWCVQVYTMQLYTCNKGYMRQHTFSHCIYIYIQLSHGLLACQDNWYIHVYSDTQRKRKKKDKAMQDLRQLFPKKMLHSDGM